MKTIEITASYSGTVHVGNYSNESPFFSIKEVIEDCQLTDDEIEIRHLELSMQCYNKFQAFKEEALLPLILKGTEPDPKCTIPKWEEMRQTGIAEIAERGKWFQDNEHQVKFRILFNDIFKKDFDGDLQKLSFMGVKTLNRKLGALQHQLNGVKKTEEKANAKKEITETSEAS